MHKFRIIDKNPPVSFKELHPGVLVGAPLKGTDLPPWAGKTGLESTLVRCAVCGFINDTAKTPEGSGYGNISVDSDGEPHVKGGCAFCGASNYIPRRVR